MSFGAWDHLKLMTMSLGGNIQKNITLCSETFFIDLLVPVLFQGSPTVHFCSVCWTLGCPGARIVPESPQRAPWGGSGIFLTDCSWNVTRFSIMFTDCGWIFEKRFHCFYAADTRTEPARQHRSPTYPATCVVRAMSHAPGTMARRPKASGTNSIVYLIEY